MWFDAPIPTRAPSGGLIDPLNGQAYRAGEFLPFYVPRPIMPQVDEDLYPDLKRFLLDHRVGVVEIDAPVRALRAHQRVDHFRAKAMLPEVLRRPVLTSQDHYILDGNHRWAAHVHLGLTSMRTLQIQRPFEEAIGLLFQFPGTYALENHKGCS